MTACGAGFLTGESSGCGGSSLLRSPAPTLESAGELLGLFEEHCTAFKDAIEERGVCLVIVARREALSYAKGSPDEADDLREDEDIEC